MWYKVSLSREKNPQDYMHIEIDLQTACLKD